MHKIFLTGALLFFLGTLSIHAQTSLFTPYDCRSHAEWFYDEPIREEIKIDSSLLAASEATETPSPPVDVWKKWTFVENYAFGKDRGAMPMITDLEALHPFFRDKIKLLVAQCKAQGINLAIVESYRTHAKQNEYKVMGKKYTNSGAGKSKHQYGLAVDVVPVIDSAAVWDNTSLWKKIGVTGEKLGLRWGGRWRKPYDPGHFEWTGGLTSVHLSAGQLPPVPEKFYPCLEEDIHILRTGWKEWETLQSSMTRK
jgi:hypothetical protein